MHQVNHNPAGSRTFSLQQQKDCIPIRSLPRRQYLDRRYLYIGILFGTSGGAWLSTQICPKPRDFLEMGDGGRKRKKPACYYLA